MNNLPKIGIIGLGIMGSAMAEELLRTGYVVSGYDPSDSARERFQALSGHICQNASEVAASSDVLIVSLSTVEALKKTVDALRREGGEQHGVRKPVIETSTLPLEDKEAAHDALRDAGFDTLDCPISGTAVRMKERAWTVFVSGDASVAEKITPILHVFTDQAPYVGAYGNGTKMKFAANHLVAIYNVACAESVNLARKMGLNPHDVLKLFGNSPVIGTGVMRLRMPFMLERKYSPPTMKVEVWQKDMQVIGDLAKSVNCPTPLFTACASIYTSAMAQGLDQQDTASVSEVLALMSGIPPAHH
jgi:putative dehydrogenase